MARRTFFSFHYKPDNWRAGEVRNMGMIEGNRAVTDNAWETITKGGDAAIKKWIAEQMRQRSCTAVLIGSATAGRKWITYEILESWNKGMGVFGVHIHGLLDKDRKQSTKGKNPFAHVSFGKQKLSTIVKAYDAPYSKSTSIYRYIRDNVAEWADEAVRIRANY